MNPIVDIVQKAGIVPYFVNDDGTIEMMFMIPSDPLYGGIYPQLAKGWVDEDESVLDAAIREGLEELGLRPSNMMTAPIEAGKSSYLDRHEDGTEYTELVTTVFTCRVHNREDFDEPHFETGCVKWLTWNDWMGKGRLTQFNLIRAVHQKIQELESPSET